MKKLLIAFVVTLAACNTTWENLRMQPEVAKAYIEAGLKAQKQYPRTYPTPNEKITDEESFVRAAEPILFDVYGKETITAERPYTIGQEDGYWIMSGHAWADKGGVFYIMISEKTGQVVYLTHGK